MPLSILPKLTSANVLNHFYILDKYFRPAEAMSIVVPLLWFFILCILSMNCASQVHILSTATSQTSHKLETGILLNVLLINHGEKLMFHFLLNAQHDRKMWSLRGWSFGRMMNPSWQPWNQLRTNAGFHQRKFQRFRFWSFCGDIIEVRMCKYCAPVLAHLPLVVLHLSL